MMERTFEVIAAVACPLTDIYGYKENQQRGEAFLELQRTIFPDLVSEEVRNSGCPESAVTYAKDHFKAVHLFIGCKCCGHVMRVWTSRDQWMEVVGDESKGLLSLLAVTVDCALNRFKNLNNHVVVSHLAADRWCRHRLIRVCLRQAAIGGAPFNHGLAAAIGNPSNHLVMDFQSISGILRGDPEWSFGSPTLAAQRPC